MIKKTILGACIIAVFESCNSSTNEKKVVSMDSIISQDTTAIDTISQDNQTVAFDINDFQPNGKLEGEFPYFKLPEGYEFTDMHSFHGSGTIKDHDKEYFYYHGIYVPQEGKTFKAVIRPKGDKQYSELEIQKSFDELIASIAGVKTNNGETLKNGEVERLEKIDRNAYSKDYLHSANNWDNVHSYLIRTPSDIVWVQYNIGNENTSITVMKVNEFENKMTFLPSSEIQKQLDKNGKAILYINFDTDIASLTPDGKKSTEEITKLLNENKTLKLSIEGHTDNNGDATHNKKLSLERAQTVIEALTKAGIKSDRLKALGLGADKPMVPNDSELNKAKNRRVELVKI